MLYSDICDRTALHSGTTPSSVYVLKYQYPVYLDLDAINNDYNNSMLPCLLSKGSNELLFEGDRSEDLCSMV